MSVVGPLFVERDAVDVGYGAAGPAAVARVPARHRHGRPQTAGDDRLGTPLTLRIGLIAGVIGLAIGIVFGFVAGYSAASGITCCAGAADVFLTIPGLLVLVVIATTLKAAITVDHPGAGRRGAGLDVPDADDPLAGADDARARLRPGRAALGDERASRSSSGS